MTRLSKNQKIASWVGQLAAAVILLQTLFFKFTGAPESIHIFEQLGAEPWGRWASGIFELITSLLLLNPGTAALGAVMGLGMMTGALLSHFTVLGIAVGGDGGTLFILACVVFLSCATVAYLRRRDIPVVGSKLS